MSKIMWWGYLHSNKTPQLKRWFGDHKDYKDDCYNNPNVLRVATPFDAPDRESAMKVLLGKLNIE